MGNWSIRVGCGYDVHALAEGRKLMLGGVEIPFSRGLQGHSDADVVLHALCDALLGAAGTGDIGVHFPDTDPQYKGIDSLILLRRTSDIIRRQGFAVSNVDVTVVAQKPRLKEFVPVMKQRIAQALELPSDDVNVKATTTEGLGFEGREEGIAAFAVACLIKEKGSGSANEFEAEDRQR